MIVTKDEASSTALIVKDAILARSGIYIYSHEEMLRRGYNPSVVKSFYKEYRPASVLVAAKDKFKYAVLTKEHPQSITADNVQQVIEGVVGSNVEVVTLDNDEIALKGELAFYTKDAVEYYTSGAKETSAQYHSKCVEVQDQDYDFILLEIANVQGLALTRQGRGGSSVAVLDSLLSAAEAEKNIQGDTNMLKSSLLSLLGIGKAPQDELSSLVIDSLQGYDGLSDAEKKARRDKVEALISPLAESNEKKILLGTVADCFSYSKEVLEKPDAVVNGLKALYSRCVADETAALQATFDSIKEKEEEETKDAEEEEAKKKAVKDAEEEEEKKKKEEEDKKKEETKDSLSLEATIARIVSQVTDSLGPKIDEAVKKHLGVEQKTETEVKDSVLPSFEAGIKDNSFLLRNIF